MFQTYENTANGADASARVSALRALFETHDIDGFLVPRVDEHQGEYVASCSERLAWLTGFTGSWGIALILKESAHVFVDGRYTVQAANQLDGSIFKVEDLVGNPPSTYIPANLSQGSRIGFDPWLHTISEVKTLRKALENIGGSLVPVANNLVDQIWADRPAPPLEPVSIQPLEHAGVPAATKIAEMAKALADAKADATILTDPASLAWLFNIRGNDVPHSPFMLGFAMAKANGETAVFVDEHKLTPKTKDYLEPLASLLPPSELEGELSKFARDKVIALDPALAGDKFRTIVESAGGSVVELQDPARLPRAR
ncbi:MAG: aminopeptidase P family N-terminal domain-containing protein, partial [Rhizobiaceae bacterium]